MRRGKTFREDRGTRELRREGERVNRDEEEDARATRTRTETGQHGLPLLEKRRE